MLARAHGSYVHWPHHGRAEGTCATPSVHHAKAGGPSAPGGASSPDADQRGTDLRTRSGQVRHDRDRRSPCRADRLDRHPRHPGALRSARTSPIQRGEVSLASVVRSNRIEFSRDIIKQASLTWIYPQVRARFPKARFLMIVRDPRDNVRSILNRLGLPGDQVELSGAQLAPACRARGAAHLERPEELGLEASTYIEALAAGWRAAADVYLDNAGGDASGEIRGLPRRQGRLRVGCARPTSTCRAVNDISHLVDVQYQPRGDREVDLGCVLRGAQPGRIEARCEQAMRCFGYEPAGQARAPE